MNEWKTPGKKTLVKCAVNQRQVVIALTGGELVYFEMDPVSLQSLMDWWVDVEMNMVQLEALHIKLPAGIQIIKKFKQHPNYLTFFLFVKNMISFMVL